MRWLKPKEAPELNGVHNKAMSLMQLKELIEEIYESKKDFDRKCKKNRTPRESMEQFMYLFFKQRFGLNNIVIEWVFSLIEAVRCFSSSDSDVALFALVLRNEVDEEFVDIQKQIKGTIEDILLSLIETNNPNKTKKIVNQIYKDRKKGFVSENIALEIINTMYTNQHPNKDEILKKLEEKVEENLLKQSSIKKEKSKSSLGNSKSKKKPFSTDRRILFSNLMKIILDMQLKTHYRFLKNLSSEFRIFDDQNHGYISLDQFKKLTQSFLEGSDIWIDSNEMVANRGSYDESVITFSDVVSLFSGKQINSQGEDITMLQFIFELNQDLSD